MKNNIVFKLAKASILKEKKNYVISFAMMIIAFLFTFIFSGYLTLTEQSDIIQRKKDYGGWSVCYENQNDLTKEFFKNSEAIDDIVSLQVSNILSNGNYVANFSAEYFEMNMIPIIEGDYPTQINEIMVLKSLGSQIGDYIDVEVVYPVNTTMHYKVVGIMDDYNKLWNTPSVDYFVCDQPVYKDYTYLSSSLSIDALLGVDDCIYNFSLLSQDASLDVTKVNGVYPSQELKLGKSDDNTIMNTFIIVVSMGLFISVFYNINQREKNVFLLRCIGMSKKNMNTYIFFEVVIITIIALMISLAVGTISLLVLSVIVYNKIGIFLFMNALKIALSYITILLVIIVCFVYLSILPISIHSMDSLIHKKERKIMKKYHKAKRMNISNLSNKISKRYRHYGVSLTLLILVEIICINTMLSYRGYFDYIEAKNSYATYEYYLNYEDKDFIYNMFSLFDEFMSGSYAYQEIDNYGKIYFLNLEGLEGRLIEGRIPKSKNECLVYQYDSFMPRYQIGDYVDIVLQSKEVYNEQEDSYAYIPTKTRQMEVVGTIDLDDYYNKGVNNVHRFPCDWLMFAVLDDAFEKDDWKNYTYLKTSKNLFFQINELSNQYNPFYKEVANVNKKIDYNNLKMIVEVVNSDVNSFISDQTLVYVPVLFIANLFIIFMVRLLVDRLNRDFKLTRCLGMTFKQVMKSYMHIGISIITYPLIYFIMRFGYNYNFLEKNNTLDMSSLLNICEPLIIACVVCLINYIGLMSYAYKKTSDTVTFYPTDVERYY